MDLSAIVPTKTVDARSMACPGPLLEAKKSIGLIKIGETIEVQSGDIGSREDFPAWCNKVGHELLGFLEKDGYDSFYVVRKK